MDNNYKYVESLNKDLRNYLKKFDKVVINSNDICVPHILNFSVLGVKPETMLHALEEYEVYISTKTACSSSGDYSKAVFALTNDKKRASSSIRVSLSHKTTKEDIEKFKKAFDDCYKKLVF